MSGLQKTSITGNWQTAIVVPAGFADTHSDCALWFHSRRRDHDRGLNYLMEGEEQGRTKAGDPSLGVITKGWRRYVSAGDGFDHKAYVFCCLDRLRSATPSPRHFHYAQCTVRRRENGPPDQGILGRCTVNSLSFLGHSPSAEETLRILRANSTRPIAPSGESCRPMQASVWKTLME